MTLAIVVAVITGILQMNQIYGLAYSLGIDVRYLDQRAAISRATTRSAPRIADPKKTWQALQTCQVSPFSFSIPILARTAMRGA